MADEGRDSDEHGSSESDDGSEDDSDKDDEVTKSGAATPARANDSKTWSDHGNDATWRPSHTISLLLTHLALGCSGLPSNYPTVILLLSTIPADLLPHSRDALDVLFESFWAAWGARALSSTIASAGGPAGKTPTEEFVAALLECLVFEAFAIQKSSTADEQSLATEAATFVRRWFERFSKAYLAVESDVSDGVKRSKSLQTCHVAEVLQGAFAKLAGRDEGEFKEIV